MTESCLYHEYRLYININYLYTLIRNILNCIIITSSKNKQKKKRKETKNKITNLYSGCEITSFLSHAAVVRSSPDARL